MTEQDSDLSEEMIVSGQLNSEGAPGRILFEKLHELENFLTHYGRAANSEESRMKLKNDKEKLESLGCLLPEDEVGLKTIINDATESLKQIMFEQVTSMFKSHKSHHQEILEAVEQFHVDVGHAISRDLLDHAENLKEEHRDAANKEFFQPKQSTSESSHL